LSTPPTTLGDTLLFADQLAPVKSPFILPSDQTGDDVIAKIGTLADQETIKSILKDSEEEVKSLTAALCG